VPKVLPAMLFLAVCASCAAPCFAQWPEAIAFTRLPGGRPEELSGQLWLMNPDGSNQRIVPGTTNFAFDPTISPDRSWLVHLRFDPADPFSRRVWLCRPDGTDQREVTPAPLGALYYRSPMWFPDNRRVLISHMPRAMADWGKGYMYGWFDVFAGGWNQLDVNGLEVALSPEGERLAVVRNGEPTLGPNIMPSHMWVTDLNGRNLGPQTTNREVFDRGPGWSPDGKRIAFFRQRRVAGSLTQLPTSDLCIMDATLGEGSVSIVVPDLFRVMSEATVVWSPDGRKLLVCSGHEGNYSVYAVTLADRRVTRLTDDRFAEEYQDWR